MIFGLSETIEGFVQESGRSMRGGDVETQGQTGLSFFLHKGALGEHFASLNVSIICRVSESKHCPPSSECRELISKPPKCQTKIILQQFGVDWTDEFDLISCKCCYNCIKTHSEGGCQECEQFLERFCTEVTQVKLSKSVASELKEALAELFMAMELRYIKVEFQLEVDCKDFTQDLLRCVDEIRNPSDIVRFWHVESDLAAKVFSVLYDVLFGGDEEYSSDEGDVEPEDSDFDSDDEEDASSIELSEGDTASDVDF